MLDDEKKKHTDNYTHMNTSYRQNEKKNARFSKYNTHTYTKEGKKRMSRLDFIRFFLMCLLNTQSYKKYNKNVFFYNVLQTNKD